jgi:hypothetical protein
MTVNEEPQANVQPDSRVDRRRFLGGVGASGLATAAVLFGRSESAMAASDLHKVGCCCLSYPSSHDIYSCESGNHYVWGCGKVVNHRLIRCDCCEHYNPNYSTGYCPVS